MTFEGSDTRFPPNSQCITAWTAARRPPLLQLFPTKAWKCRWQNDDSSAARKNTGQWGWMRMRMRWMKEIIRKEQAEERLQQETGQECKYRWGGDKYYLKRVMEANAKGECSSVYCVSLLVLVSQAVLRNTAQQGHRGCAQYWGNP